MGRMKAFSPHTLSQRGKLGRPSSLGHLTLLSLGFHLVPCKGEREMKGGERGAPWGSSSIFSFSQPPAKPERKREKAPVPSPQPPSCLLLTVGHTERVPRGNRAGQ